MLKVSMLNHQSTGVLSPLFQEIYTLITVKIQLSLLKFFTFNLVDQWDSSATMTCSDLTMVDLISLFKDLAE
jgi:hypothetical protein